MKLEIGNWTKCLAGIFYTSPLKKMSGTMVGWLTVFEIFTRGIVILSEKNKYVFN
ncbi:MAG: hypothetical protein GY757_39115 [bacterium]|nr:hypothetical protein [bacterium]